ncbi:MAG TPA: hypothetical protein VKA49_01600 [Flavitalea sp.]|nr:hypothetical protein [Flavitalea sp.]
MSAIIKNPLQRDGTSQEERLAKALLPGHAKIDDRKIEEIIAFATEYSKLINYYNTGNVPEGDWSCFYENDPCILLALLTTIDTNSIEASFKVLEEKIQKYLTDKECEPVDDCGPDPLPGYFDEIINLIFGVAVQIQRACKKLPKGHLLKEEIVAIIRSDLHLSIIDNKQQDALIKLIGYDKASIEPMNDYSPFIKEKYPNCECTQAWQLDQEGFDCIYPDNSYDLNSLKALFYIFFIALVRIKLRAKIYFEECIAKNDSHHPHVTLFLTFLYLFQYAVDHLNTLTRSHLLYYYEKVLCLHRRKESPDKAHVIFELAKNFNTHLVEEGTLLNAGKDDTSKSMVYALMEEVVVNKAKVEQLKTVYIDETTGIVHASPFADTKDGLGEKFNNDEQPHWKPLGGPDSPIKEVGFALASPMFFLKEGLRVGMLSYKLSAVTDIKLLQKATSFRIQYSSEKEWVEIENAYDVAERILVKYPILRKKYADNFEAIQKAVNDGFDKLKELYNKFYPVGTGLKPSASAGTTASGEFNVQELLSFIENADINSLTALITGAPALSKPSSKKAKKSAFGPSPAAGPEEEKALKKEIMQIRNDILAIKSVFVNRSDFKDGSDIKELDFFFVANATSPAFTPLQVDELSSDIRSEWPVIRTFIKNQTADDGDLISQYNDIKGLRLNGVDIKVAAYGLKDLVVQNDTAILDNSKEIQPFTNRPYIGSYFYIGNWEVFQKKLDFVGAQLEWADRPLNFANYYTNYIHPPTSNADYKVNAELLNGGIYQDVFRGNKQELFADSFQGKTIIWLGRVKDDTNDNGDGDFPTPPDVSAPGLLGDRFTRKQLTDLQKDFELRDFSRDPSLPVFADNNVNVRRGFMRLTLAGKDFLHAEYPQALMKLLVGADAPIGNDKLINEPYTPKLKNTSLFYISTERTLFGAEAIPQNNPNASVGISSTAGTNASIEQFYHVTPFGYQQLQIGQLNEVYLLPQFNNAELLIFTQGNLYIGLKDAVPEQKVNILFQVLEGSGDNRYAPPDIEWNYLVSNEWIAFKPFEIQDHTRADESSRKSLLKSGMIEFSLPKAINSNATTILDNELLWIRACTHEEPVFSTDSNIMQGIQRIAALPDLVAVIAQAGIAEFENHDNSLSHLALPLPAKTIQKLVDSRAAIKTVSQPYYSFDGRLPENDYQFYRRISERLRHKNRSICIWEYERLVLEQFPDLHKVKCLNHTSILQNKEIAPGFVTLAVIPDLRNKNAANKLEPRVSVGVLDEIKVFLKRKTNLFVASPFDEKLDYLQLVNPLYEQIKVKTCVRFYTGLDVAYYKYVLNDDLKKFLAPWAFDTNKEINFGSTYHKSAILNFIEERKYVDVVLGFSVQHYKDGVMQPDYDPDWIIPTTSRSILTSYNVIDPGSENEHEIEFTPYVEDDPCPSCILTPAIPNALVVGAKKR